MGQRRFSLVAVTLVLAAACTRGGEQGGGGKVDPAQVSGSVVLSGWAASPEERTALDKVLSGFKAKFPKITIDYQPIAGDYPATMLAKFTARQPPDLFYVDSSVAPEWIDQGLLMSLDGFAEANDFDTDPFYPGFLNAFKGPDGKLYGFPKDGNTLAMAYNTELLQRAAVASPPKTHDELEAAAAKLQAAGIQPMCLSHSLDRALAFILARGGSLLSEDQKAPAIQESASKGAIGWYLGLFKKGYGKRPADLGADWCGKALGEQKVAIVFEGGWVDPFMAAQYPAVKYAWAEMPQASKKSTLSFTVSYSIGTHSASKDQAWVLLTYLTGPDGMEMWTEGGVANPSRKDVTAAAGKEIFAKQAEFARPWSFTPGFTKYNDAFNNAMTAAIEAGSDNPDEVAAKTEASILEVLR